MADSGSTVPRRQLGRHLRQAREQAGIALEAAAEELEFSRTKMWRIETGQATVRTADVTALCRLYQVPEELAEVLVNLAKEARTRGWWHAYGEVIPDWFELYVGLESEACRLRQYEPALVPGLLQTERYAEAVYRTRPGTTDDGVAQAVALRMERQRLLRRVRPPAPQLEVVLDEVALRRAVPGMAGQLDALVSYVDHPSISVRVIPTVSELHRASDAGSFAILDFPAKGARAAEPTVVYSELLTGALYLDKVEEVRTYAEAWRALTGLALTEPESAKFIQMIREKDHGV